MYKTPEEVKKLLKKALFPERVDVIKAWVFTEEALYLLDQRLLPEKEAYLLCSSANQVKKAIQNMVVRGAPAIGIVGAIGFYLGLSQLFRNKKRMKLKSLERECEKFYSLLIKARPTAVNLKWALDRIKQKLKELFFECNNHKKKTGENVFLDKGKLLEFLKNEVLKIWEEDIEGNLKMAEYGSEVLPEGDVMTYCNTGALATGGYGTALGIIRHAFEKGKINLVWVCETRPFFQGARLTAWELSKLGIPYKIITDNSAGFVLKEKKVKSIVVGADRIAKNGDTANKIGTYSLAILAKFHRIPFYVAAPSSTFDLTIDSGKEIPVEIRKEEELLTIGKKRISPKKASAFYPAFDITPSELITAFITEKGVIHPPFKEEIAQKIGI